MNPLRMQFDNLFSYKSADLPLSEMDFALIKGKSGSGKSSIFDVLFWLKYGKTARKKYKDVLRNIPDKPKSGGGKVWIEDDDGTVYRIERRTGKGKGLMLYNDKTDKPVEFRTPTLIQQRIDKIIGMDFETALNVAYFSQGDVGKFLTCESSERIEIINNILRINFEQLKKNIDNDLKGISASVENIRGQIQVYRNAIETTDVKELQKEKRATETVYNSTNSELVAVSQYFSSIREKQEILNSIDNLKQTFTFQYDSYQNVNTKLKAQITSLKTRKDNSKEIQDQINACHEQLEECDELERQLESTQGTIDTITESITTQKTKKQSYEEQIIELGDVKEMIGKECPTCKEVVTPKHLAHIATRIDQLNNLIKQCENLTSKKQSLLRTHIATKNRLTTEIAKMKQIKATETSLKSQLKEIKDRKNKIIELTSQKTENTEYYKTQLDDLKKQIKNKQDDLKYYSEYDLDKLDEYQAKYEQLEAHRQQYEQLIHDYKNQIQVWYANKKRLDELEKQIGTYEQDYKVMLFWKDSLPKIKADISSSVIPFIESETNKYLSQILPGKIIKFEVDPDKSNNKLEIVIYDYEHNVKRIYEGWSGGEKDKMTISVYLSLNKLASIRSGKQINFLILDEKFAMLDDESRVTLLDMLKREYSDRKIWAISHVKDLDKEFDVVINVEKKNNISNISITRKVAA